VSRHSVLTHKDLHLYPRIAGVRSRAITKITGIAPQGSLGVFNADLSTLATALLERMYFCDVGGVMTPAPSPSKEVVNKKLQLFRTHLFRHSSRVTALTLEEVVETYSGRKRAIYEGALRCVQVNGVVRRDAFSAAFVKVEKGNTVKAPRCIQPRRPAYNLAVGQYIKPLEHAIYRWIARVFGDGPTVMKGYNVERVARIARGKWDSFHHPVAVGLDATKFDMHVSEAMLSWEHNIYLQVFNGNSELRELLRWQMNNIGGGYCDDGKLKYSVVGKRFSGDMNTALGNCLIMCAMVWSYAQERGVHVKLINNGDDCVVFMEMEDLSRFSVGLNEWFLDLGFRMTVEDPVEDFQKVEFCQMKPIEVAEGWTMVRNITTALTKDTLCTLPVRDEVGLRKWMFSVGTCGLALCRGVPMMQNFYRAYVREGIDDHGRVGNAVQMQSGMRMLAVGLEERSEQITDKARYDVYLAWGITPDEQVAAEEYYDRWKFDYAPTDIIDEPLLYQCL